MRFASPSIELASQRLSGSLPQRSATRLVFSGAPKAHGRDHGVARFRGLDGYLHGGLLVKTNRPGSDERDPGRGLTWQ